MADPENLVRDPAWMPHRLDLQAGRVLFLRIERERLRDGPFLAGFQPQGAGDAAWLDLETFRSAQVPAGTMHFVFHTAFCRSTLLAHALDIPHVAASYSEPGIINDIAAAGDAALPLLAPALAFFARPRLAGEAVFVKPSNHANTLIPAMMQARPESRAILLSHPVEAFLSSIHRKGLPGRSWARRLYLEIQRYSPLDLGMDAAASFAMSDLQVAGLAWLLNRRWFAQQMAGARGDAMRSLDGEALVARTAQALAAIGAFTGVAIDDEIAARTARGEVFARDPKSGRAYEEAATLSADPHVTEEVTKVAQWIGQVAAQAGVPMDQPRPLLQS